ncbi:MAG: GNAT family N-acetyltransferase [Candidatus Schekmanbacteria bacterium]|nr:GNAT family N-acetyltransferase [Candidatus Schekmanbacteria bacterium]
MRSHRSEPFDPDWERRCGDRIRTAAEAVAVIRSGQRVFLGTGCGEPAGLVGALASRRHELADVTVVQLLSTAVAPHADPECLGSFLLQSFFITDSIRAALHEGRGDYVPISLSEIPRLFDSGQIALDAALIQVTPPDSRGWCSLGVSVDIVKAAAANARLVIAEVNQRLPRALGDAFVQLDDIDILVPVDRPLVEVARQPLGEAAERVASNAAALIPNGATLEVGIARIPHAILKHLGSRKDLGIHTEMLSDAVADLVATGAVTGKRKAIDSGLIVASFAVGSQRLFDWLHNNPAISFRPTAYVNDPATIARNPCVCAINAALQVDLTGQVCADSLGDAFYAGVGGQVDFSRGAAASPGGRAIIALPSTARQGSVSRIVTHLSAGAGVVMTRGDVHYVVTEHGAAYLHGKTVQERAMSLIAIADPVFRQQLLDEAIAAGFVRTRLDAHGRHVVVGPSDQRASLRLSDGTLIDFRPIHPTDEPNMRDMFYALSPQTITYRFFAPLRTFPHRSIDRFLYVDHRGDVAIVGVVPAAHGDEIIAIGRYCLEPGTNHAEVAFLVRDDWQGKGIGSFLLRHLTTIARRHGIGGFTASVLGDNRPMQRVFENSGLSVRARCEEGVLEYQLDFT